MLVSDLQESLTDTQNSWGGWTEAKPSLQLLQTYSNAVNELYLPVITRHLPLHNIIQSFKQRFHFAHVAYVALGYDEPMQEVIYNHVTNYRGTLEQGMLRQYIAAKLQTHTPEQRQNLCHEMFTLSRLINEPIERDANLRDAFSLSYLAQNATASMHDILHAYVESIEQSDSVLPKILTFRDECIQCRQDITAMCVPLTAILKEADLQTQEFLLSTTHREFAFNRELYRHHLISVKP